MFRLIGFILRYLPLIISAVTMVEGLVSKDTPGADKKALVMATLKQFLTTAGVTLSPATEGIVGQAIDLAVAVMNALGIFKKGGEEEAPELDSQSVATDVVASPQAVRVAVYPNDERIAELQAILEARE